MPTVHRVATAKNADGTPIVRHHVAGSISEHTFDFSSLFATGESITSVLSTAVYLAGVAVTVAPDVTVVKTTFVSTIASVQVTDGVAGKTYEVKCRVLTSKANEPVMNGYLFVGDR